MIYKITFYDLHFSKENSCATKTNATTKLYSDLSLPSDLDNECLQMQKDGYEVKEFQKFASFNLFEPEKIKIGYRFERISSTALNYTYIN